MGPGRDDREKARQEREEREFAQSIIEAAEAVRQRVGEGEWRRIRLWRTVGWWMIGIGLLVAGWTGLTPLESWLSRVAPWAAAWLEPLVQAGPTVLTLLIGGGIALIVVGLLVARSGNRRLREAAGSEMAAEAIFMYLSAGPEVWEKAAGEEEATEEATAQTGAAPAVVDWDEWEHRHWLRVELSGAHLIWWLAFAATALYALSPLGLLFHPPSSPGEFEAMLNWGPPDWLMHGIFAIAVVGLLLKGLVPGLWFAAWDSGGRNPDTYRELKRYYRFWARGLLPAALALAPALIYWGVRFTGLA